jgi:hypothetical protein
MYKKRKAMDRGREMKEQRTGDEGTADGKQRNNRPEKWNRATEKGTIGRLIGLGDRERRMKDKG